MADAYLTPHICQVCVRVKPLDVAREEECAWMWQDNVITQTVFPPWEAKSLYRQASGRAQISYGFDHLFTPTHSTQNIYDEVRRVPQLAPPGLNSSSSFVRSHD